MKSRIFAALWAIALLALTAPVSWGQAIARVTIVPATVYPGDTATHVDVAIHRGLRLQSATLRVRAFDAAGNPVPTFAASWAADNPAVATVAAGQVTAHGAGATLVTVHVSGGVAGAIRVCVSDTGAGAQPVLQQWPAVSMPNATDDPIRQAPAWQLSPGERGPFAAIAPNDTTPGAMRFELARAGTPWPLECLHWLSTDTARVRVDRLGFVTNVSSQMIAPATLLRVRVGPP